MCGITGFWTKDRWEHTKLEKTALAMSEKIRFRGPDSFGLWVDDEAGLALAHRRLSILDLSEAGHQPMVSPSGRYVITFNGEVYNYNTMALRPHLEKAGYVFKGHSDTEVMLAAIEHDGLLQAIKHFRGMFAFAVFDRHERKLHLVRDRVGVKPLYYGVIGRTLFLGSQCRSFYPHPEWNPTLSQSARAEFLAYNYIPGDMSVYREIQKVTPGSVISFDADFNQTQSFYWDMTASYDTATPFQNDKEAIDQLHETLRAAVRLRMIADVPLGAFLSGGMDSSLVVALMQEANAAPVKTFTIGFQEDRFNEAHYAEAVAAHLKTDHHTFYLSSKDALDIIPSLTDFFDEPFADSSQIPTYLVSKMAREHVTVALSGDGGDEFFAGYTRHRICEKLWRYLGTVPEGLRKRLVPLMKHTAHSRYNILHTMIEKALHLSHPADKLIKLSDLLCTNSGESLFHSTYLLWDEKEIHQMTGQSLQHFKNVWEKTKSARTFTDQMQLCDALMYLEGDILTKVDRASMAHSLEAREPLLDHHVIERAWRLPMSLKLQGGIGKIALRRILEQYVPKNLIDRPKQGFGVPIAQWLRGPLKDWAMELMSKKHLEENGFLDTHPILKRLDAHMSFKHDRSYSLWGILMYQAWQKKYNE